MGSTTRRGLVIAMAVSLALRLRIVGAAYTRWFPEGSIYCRVDAYCGSNRGAYQQQRLYYCPTNGSCYPTTTTSAYWTGRCCYAA